MPRHRAAPLPNKNSSLNLAPTGTGTLTAEVTDSSCLEMRVQAYRTAQELVRQMFDVCGTACATALTASFAITMMQ